MQYIEYTTGETILMRHGKFLCYSEVYTGNTQMFAIETQTENRKQI